MRIASFSRGGAKLVITHLAFLTPWHTFCLTLGYLRWRSARYNATRPDHPQLLPDGAGEHKIDNRRKPMTYNSSRPGSSATERELDRAADKAHDTIDAARDKGASLAEQAQQAGAQVADKAEQLGAQ